MVDLAETRATLERVAETLADAALAELREAVEAGGDRRPAAEKTLTRARRSVEKAIALLDGLEDDGRAG